MVTSRLVSTLTGITTTVLLLVAPFTTALGSPSMTVCKSVYRSSVSLEALMLA